MAAATAFIAINLWTGAPLVALWVGSKTSGKTVLSMQAVFVVVLVLALLLFPMVLALAWLNESYNTLTGRPHGERRLRWLRSMNTQGEDEGDQPASARWSDRDDERLRGRGRTARVVLLLCALVAARLTRRPTRRRRLAYDRAWRRPPPRTKRRSRPGTVRCSTASCSFATCWRRAWACTATKACAWSRRVPGERALDVGCGFGDTAQQLAELVGPDGSVLGVDASPRFIETARQEAAQAERRQRALRGRRRRGAARFDERSTWRSRAWARCSSPTPSPRCATSAQALVPGGRLAMVVWRSKVENECFYRGQLITERFVSKPEEYDEPTCGPGPFSMGNADTTSGILLSAGFENIALHALRPADPGRRRSRRGRRVRDEHRAGRRDPAAGRRAAPRTCTSRSPPRCARTWPSGSRPTASRAGVHLDRHRRRTRLPPPRRGRPTAPRLYDRPMRWGRNSRSPRCSPRRLATAVLAARRLVGDRRARRGPVARARLPHSAPPIIHDGFPEPPARYSHDGVLDTTLRASLGKVLLNHRRVTALSYDGSFPGPTLVICAGDTLQVHLQNDTTEPTNLHTHGFHVSPEANHDNVFLQRRTAPELRLRIRHPRRHAGRAPTGITRTCTCSSSRRSSPGSPARSCRRAAWTRCRRCATCRSAGSSSRTRRCAPARSCRSANPAKPAPSCTSTARSTRRPRSAPASCSAGASSTPTPTASSCCACRTASAFSCSPRTATRSRER